MVEGMLWFDNDAELDLITKVDRAVKHFLDKYGQKPVLCFVHPSMINGKLPQVRKTKPLNAESVELWTCNRVLPDHFWITNNGKDVSATSKFEPGDKAHRSFISINRPDILLPSP